MPIRRVCAALAASGAVLMPFAPAGGQKSATPEPAVVELRNANIWEHHVGSPGSIRLSAEEMAEIRAANRFPGSFHSIPVEVVVSADGLVESAELKRPPEAAVKAGLPSVLAAHEAEALQLVRARRYKPWTDNGVAERVRVEDAVSVYPPESWGAPVPFPASVDRSGLKMTLERTRCYGPCPAYSVSLGGDGAVSFDGRSDVAIPGHHVAKVSEAQVSDLLERFRKADFLSAKDVYRLGATDLPTYKLTLAMGTTTKTVIDYAGLEVGMPSVIAELEDAIDDVAESSRWVTGGAGTAAVLDAEHWNYAAATADNVALYNKAITSGDAEWIARFVATKAPVVGVEKVPAPLCTASFAGNAELVQTMLGQMKVLPAGLADDCLVSAAGSGNVRVLEIWLGRGADPKGTGHPLVNRDERIRESPLEAAVISGSGEMVRTLLKLGGDPNSTGTYAEPMLILAVQRQGPHGQQADVVQALLDGGANPNISDRQGRTPLSADDFYPALVPLLVQAGAKVDALDSHGATPLIQHSYEQEMIRALLAAGADPTLKAKDGETALHRAREQFHCEPCAALIEDAIRRKEGAALTTP